MSFMLYVLGFIIMISGLAYGAYLLGVEQQWIVVGVIVLLGMGIAMAVPRTRRRDPPAP